MLTELLEIGCSSVEGPSLALISGELGTEVAGEVWREDEVVSSNESRRAAGLPGEDDSEEVDVLISPVTGCLDGVKGTLAHWSRLVVATSMFVQI